MNPKNARVVLHPTGISPSGRELTDNKQNELYLIMSKNFRIGETFLILVVSAIVLLFGKMTLDKWDAEEWGLMALGIFATLGSFTVMVGIVTMMLNRRRGDDDD